MFGVILRPLAHGCRFLIVMRAQDCGRPPRNILMNTHFSKLRTVLVTALGLASIPYLFTGARQPAQMEATRSSQSLQSRQFALQPANLPLPQPANLPLPQLARVEINRL